MTPARRNQLRRIMLLAWGLYRAEKDGPNPRTFADALAGAWRFIRRAAHTSAPAWAKGSHPRHVRFGSMVQSPIRRSLGNQPYAATSAARAGYLTSRLGR